MQKYHRHRAVAVAAAAGCRQQRSAGADSKTESDILARQGKAAKVPVILGSTVARELRDQTRSQSTHPKGAQGSM